MPGYGLFVGFGHPVRGREQKAATVFDEFVRYWTKLQQDGAIEGWEPIFLEPHGGDLGGFFLVRGDRDAIASVRSSDELATLSSRAQLIVENFGVVGAEMGDRIAQRMQVFLEASAELA